MLTIFNNRLKVITTILVSNVAMEYMIFYIRILKLKCIKSNRFFSFAGTSAIAQNKMHVISPL